MRDRVSSCCRCLSSTCRAILFAVVLWLSNAVGSNADGVPGITDIGAVPYLDSHGREQYAKFLTAKTPRAFAIAPAGGYGWSSESTSAWRSITTAIFRCNTTAKGPCYLYAEDRNVMLDLYKIFDVDSEIKLLEMKAPARDAYNLEAEPSPVPARSSLRRRTEGYHALTPNRIPGATVVNTGQLARSLLLGQSAVLIDVLASEGHETLPGAYWFHGAGLEWGVGKDPKISAQ